MGESGTKRRRILVDGKFQLGISLQIVGYVYLYLVLFALLANFNAIKAVIVEDGSSAVYIEAVGRLTIFVQVFVLPLVLTFVCMCLHGLLFSHRLAGPIHRFKESVKRLRRGDLGQDVSIREHDYFQDLCEELNGLTARLRTDLANFRSASHKLAEEGESLARSGNLPPDATRRLIEFANASAKLRQLADGYRIGGTAPENAPAEVLETVG